MREFLMVDGEMYCSSSFAGNTRRYHGLLAYQGLILLSALHDEANGIRLSSGYWGHTFVGEGLSWVLGGILYPVTHEYAIPGARIRRTFLLDGGLTIRYEVIGTALLTVRPLMTNRPVSELCQDPIGEINEQGGTLLLNGCTFTSDLLFTREMQRYQNACYPHEQEHGYDAFENLISPGYFSGNVTNRSVEIRVTPKGCYTSPALSKEETNNIVDHAARLCVTGDRIQTGYHKIRESRGRDTFISLPGLLLETGRFREAEEIFHWHLAHRKGGLLLNHTPDSYNTADTTLWFFWALFQYVQKLPGSPFIATIRHDIEDLLNQYTHSGISTLDGNLIRVEAGSTWMDMSQTPRDGMPVEINALWILALELMEYLKISTPVRSTAAHAEFKRFWNPNTECLYDRLGPDDPSIRSNQIIALAFGLIPFDDGNKALQVIGQELLTPYGLRTLSPSSPGYLGMFTGDCSNYNGMVWPWQTGFYLDALIQYGASLEMIQPVIVPLWEYFLTDGAGMLPEMFDGDAPHQPAGSICQAWSIAELIRSRNTLLRWAGELMHQEENKKNDNYLFA